MPSFNQVNLMGHLTKSPELAYLESQTAVCNFGLAVNDKYKSSSGKLMEKVLFIDCTLFGKRGEAFNKYLKKGDPVMITGKLVYETWTDKEDKKHYKHKVQVREFAFIGGKKSTADGAAPDDTNDDDLPI